MKRLLIIGATVVALSATAAVAWAGTGPFADIGSHVATQTHGQDIDPIVVKVLDRIQNMWQWQGHDAGHQVAERAHQVADPIRDAVHEHDVDAIYDPVDQVRDRAHDVADPARNAVHAQDMDRDRATAQDRDMAEGHTPEQSSDHTRDAVQAQDMDRDRATAQDRDMAEGHTPEQSSDHTRDAVRDMDQNMDRSVGQDHMAGQGRMDR